MAASVTNPGNRQYKTIIRIEKAVRLEQLQIPHDDIARHLGMTPTALSALKATDEYIAARTTVLTGVLSQLDAELGEDISYLREKVRTYVPAALQVLVRNLNHPDAKIAQAAADDLLDRDGRMAKVTRVGLPDEDQGGIGPKVDTSVADGLISTLAALNKGALNGNTNNQGSTGNNTSTSGQTAGSNTTTGSGTTSTSSTPGN